MNWSILMTDIITDLSTASNVRKETINHKHRNKHQSKINWQIVGILEAGGFICIQQSIFHHNCGCTFEKLLLGKKCGGKHLNIDVVYRKAQVNVDSYIFF